VGQPQDPVRLALIGVIRGVFTDLSSSVGLDFEQVSDVLVRRARQDRWSGSKLTNMLWRLVLTSHFKFQGLLVGEARDPYLLRVYLRRKDPPTTGTSYYLHYFFRGDADPELHNHGWVWGSSIILTGGYIEERLMPDRKIIGRKLLPGHVNRWRHDTFHRVTLLQTGCWTLCRTGPRVADRSEDDWGFLNPQTGHYCPHGEFRHVQAARSAQV
jgi:hypothetical protein